MIGTIGSLVQETFARRRWWLAIGLYTIGSLCASMFVGMLASGVGLLLRDGVCHSSRCQGGLGAPATWGIVIGLLAIAYAISDLGYLPLPRPVAMYAVPLAWWRRWQPYGASLAYGVALGLGIMTRNPFGAFYVLLAICMLNGSVGYGALLMGTYGAARAIALLAGSWASYRRQGGERGACALRGSELLRLSSRLVPVRMIIACVLFAFGVQLLLSAVLAG